MKQKNFFIRILVVLVLTIFATGALRAQAVIQVGTGTTAAAFFLENYAYNVYSQNIYTADLLPPSMEITEIAWEYVGSRATGKRMKIWLSTTTEDDINGKFVTSETNRQVVFEGVLQRTPPSGGAASVWLPIVLQTPYSYNGGNLVISASFTDADWAGSEANFRVTPSSTGKHTATLCYGDINTSSFLEGVFGTMRSGTVYTNIKLTYQVNDAPILSISPNALDFEEQLTNTTENQTVTVSNIGAGTLTLSGVNISDPAFSCNATFPIVLNAGTSQQIDFSFSPEIENNYSATAQFTIIETEYYGNNTITLKGKALDVLPTTAVVGTGTTPGSYLIDQSWYRTYTQVIYTADLLPPVMEISEIAYEYVGTDARTKRIKVWFSITNEDDINGKYVSSEGNKQVVFEGVINRTPPSGGEPSAWLPLVLQTPYLYNGGNLVVTTSFCDMNWGQNTQFRISPSTNGKYVTSYHSEDGASNDFMENITAVKASYNTFPNIKFTYQSIDGPIFSIAPNALNFPEQMINTTETQTVAIANVGTGTITVSGIDFSDPTVFSCDANFPIVLEEGEAQQVTFIFTPDVQKNYSETAQFIILESDYFGSNVINFTGKARDFEPIDTRCWVEIDYPGSTANSGPHSNSRYTANQYIVYKDEIGTDIEGRIRRIGWRATIPCSGYNVIAVYLKNTDLEEFPLNGAIFTKASEMTKVYEGPYMFNEAGWNYLDIEPFLYDGTSNILVTTVQLETSANNLSNFQCVVNRFRFPQWWASHSALNISSTSLPIDPYNPPNFPASGTYSTLGHHNPPEICFVLDEIPQEPYIATSKKFLDYDEQEMNTINTLPVTVKNFGYGDMIITNIAFTSEDFYVTDVTFPIVIPFAGELTINFAVTPLQLELKTGKATFEFETPTLGNPQIDLSVFGLRFKALREGFEKELFPPIGWKVVDANNDGKSWKRYKRVQGEPWHFIRPPYQGHGLASCDQDAGNPGTDPVHNDWLITPKMKYETGDKFSFYLACGLSPDMNRFYVKLSKASDNIADFNQTIDFIQADNVFYMKYEYDLGDLGLKSGEEFYIGFQEFSFWTSRYVQIDEIRGPAKVMLNHDLMTQEFNASATTHGAAIHRVGVAQNYSAVIANAGVNSIAGADYTVELCRYDQYNNVIVLASMPGQNLAREDYYIASFNYAFTQAGKFRTFIRVNYAQDQNLENNISNFMMIDVLPENVEFITSGTIDPDPGAIYRWMVPVYFNTAGWMGSLSQTYHPKSHFNGVSGIITRYAYYIEHPVVRANKDIKIYMANSNLPAFNVPGSYPNANEMDLVFDGRLTFPKANKPFEMFEIGLHKPFFYTGEHLIVMIEYQGGEGMDGDPAFTAVVNQEPRIIYKMTQPFNVNNVNGSGLQLMNMAPVTSFWIEKADGIGILSGKVVYSDGTTPLPGAKVVVTSATYPNLDAVAYTDATGAFMFPKIVATNDLKVTISHFECIDYVHNNVVLNVDEHVILPLTIMESRPKVAISGRVICNAQLPVSGVKVAFFGLENYETSTGADGTFTIPNMWGGTTYRLELERSGYQKNYFGDVAVLAANINLGDITILQIPYPVHALTATEQENGSAQLSWYGPFDPHPKIFRRDNGTHWANVMADSPNPNLALGPAFHDLATIQKVMWYQATEMGIPQTTSSNIFLYGLLPNGQPNVFNLLGSYMNVPTIPNQWNEFVLPTEVEATNGFAVGIASAHTRLVLAFDNGSDPNWPWRPNTQWVLSAGSYSSPLESAIGLGVNMLIRAEGIWKGYFDITTGKSAEGITQSESLEKQNSSGLSVTQNVDLPSLELQPSNRLVLVDESVSRTPEFEFEVPHMPNGYLSTQSQSPQTGYDIYRATLPGSFIKINSSLITASSYNDATYASLSRGEFQYAVKTIYMNGVESGFVYSNVLVKDMYVTLNINVTHNATGFDNTILAGASVSLRSNNRTYTGTLDATGIISSDEFYRGIYTLTINASGFETYTQTIDFTTQNVVYNINVVLIEEIIKPYVLEVKVDPVTLNEADFTWNPLPFFDGAEDHEDFAIANIANWTMRNITGQSVAYSLNSTWPNAGVPQAFTVFNPKTTTPPIATMPTISGRDWAAHEGDKYFLSWVSYGPYGTTDRWMISKEFDFDAPFEVSFYVNALRFAEPYRVLYSMGSDQVSHFTAVGGTRRANASNTTWQKVTVQMPAEAKRVAFQHYYENADLGLMIDNITIGIPKQQTHTFKYYEVFLDGEYVGQTTTTDFKFTQLQNGVRTAGVVAVYASGSSEMETKDFVVNAPLAVYGLTPANGSTGVALNAEVSVMFNDNITANDLSGITINGNAATTTISGNKLMINHADFNYETQYTIYVPANAINGYEQAITWSFTTEDKPVYTIAASVTGGNGAISPSGAVPVTWGESQTFHFTPITGYRISQVLVNGVNNEDAVNTGSYTFTNVTGNHTISVSFVIRTFTITVAAGANGTITPGTTTANYGSTPTFTITPNTGYHILSISIDGVEIDYTVNAELTALHTYVFAPVTANHTITATFALNCYLPVITTDAGVTVTPVSCIPHGSPVTFTIIPDYCYDITQVLINGVNQGANYTIANVTGKPTVEVSTLHRQYTITATPAQGIDPMGYISPAGPATVNCGDDKEYFFHPEVGYRVSGVFVDGAQISAPTTIRRYTLENISADKTIHIEFELFPQYIIQFGPRAAQNAGGVVFPTDEPHIEFFIAVDSGTVAYPFTIQAFEGFEIDKVYVDDVMVNVTGTSTMATYEFLDLDAPHSIFATFKPIMYTIMATSDFNGTITPKGAVQVEWGNDKTFQMIGNEGYVVSNVIVNGESKGTLDSYTFEDVKANGTIHATFTKILYPITTTVTGGNGYIVPSANPIMVPHGDNITLTFVPNQGYRVNQVLINNIPNPAAALAGAYTFTNVAQAHEVEVTFTKLTFTITATATAGGFINLPGTTTVEYGTNSPIYVFTPEAGFYIRSVLVNGAVNHEAMQNGMYRFLNVTANQTLHVIFATDEFTIVATATQGGNITPSGAVNVPANANRRFDFAAQQGFTLARVMVNGINNPGAVTDGYYVFENVKADHTIAAIFERKTYTVTLPNVAGAVVTPEEGYTTTVIHGGKFMFTVAIAAAYDQSNYTVRVNGMILNPIGGVYTINNIVMDQDIAIMDVELNQYRVTARAYAGGTINPDGIIMVTHGADKTFTITPNTNFEIDRVVANGVVVELVNDTYTLGSITADATIEAYFKRKVVGIDEYELNINVFSHNNVVTILNENLVPVKQVDIMDMYGRVVWQGPTTGERTEITLHVAVGIYAVRILTGDNQFLTTKIVIN